RSRRRVRSRILCLETAIFSNTRHSIFHDLQNVHSQARPKTGIVPDSTTLGFVGSPSGSASTSTSVGTNYWICVQPLRRSRALPGKTKAGEFLSDAFP